MNTTTSPASVAGISSFLAVWKSRFQSIGRHLGSASLLAAIAAFACGAASKASAATITTDQHDYPPNSVAVIYGSGFAANETVTVVVHHDDPATPEEDPWDIWLNHEPWTVQADANGNFVTSWYVASDCLGATLKAKATGMSSGLEATVWFTDASSVGNLELWFNRAGGWGGTANGTNSGWKENDSVPMRWSATLNGGTTYRLYIGQDFKKDAPDLRHFADSFYQFDITAATTGLTMPTEATVTSGTGVSGSPTTVVILPDTSTTNTPPSAGNNDPVTNVSIPNQGSNRVLKFWGVSSATWVGYQTRVGSISGSGDNSKYGVVDIVVAGTGNKTVVLTYGAHLASRKDYGLGNGASRWPGGSGKFGIIVDEGADGLNLSGVTTASLQSAGILIEQTGTLVALNGDTHYYGDTTFNLSVTPKDADTGTNTNVAATFTIVSVSGGTATLAGSTITGTATSGGTTTATLTLNGTGTAVVQANIPANSTYTSATTSASFIVNPRPITITAGDASKNYGTVFNPTAFTVTSSLTPALWGSETISAVTLTSSGSPANAPVATYPIVPSAPLTTGGGFNALNYAITYVNGTLTVNQGQATITVDNKTKTYGDPNPTLTATVTGTSETLNYTLSTTATQFSPVVGGGYPITATLGSNPNFIITVVPGTLTITPRAASVTADNKSKTYGDANPTLTATVTGTVNGDTLNYTLACTADTTTGVGSVPITVSLGSNPNYTVTPVNGTLTINPKDLLVTANSGSKTYGTISTGFGVSATGLINGNTVTSATLTSAGFPAAATVGSYAIVPSAAVGTGLGNYTISYANGSITINRADAKNITVTPYNVVYDGASHTATGTATGVLNEDLSSLLNLSNTTHTSVSVYSSDTWTFNAGNTNPNYNSDGGTITDTITAKPLTITANSTSKTYGQLVTFVGTEFTTSAMVAGESVASATITSAGAAANAAVSGSPYTINIGSAVAGAGTSLSNYNVSYVTGLLTINKANASGILSGETDAGVNKGTSNVVNFTSFAGQFVTLHADVSGVAGGAVPSGTVKFYQFLNQAEFDAYSAASEPAREAIKATAGKVGTINFSNGVITPATATIIDLTGSMALTSTLDGTGRGNLGPLNYPILAVGHHLLAFDYSGDSNYNKFDPVMDWGVVQVPTSTSVVASASPIYGSAITFTATVTSTQPTYANFNPGDSAHGFVEGTVTFKDNGVAFATVPATGHGQPDGTLVVSTTRSLPAGNGHTITAEFFDGLPTDPTPGAYGASTSQVTPDVAKKALTITANSTSKNYGQTVTFAGTEFTSSGLVGSDSITSVTLTSAGAAATAAASTTPYAIIPSAAVGTGLGNYTITYVNGALTVNKISASVTATNQSKNYGVLVTPAGTEFTTSGFVNGDAVTTVSLASAGYVATATVAGGPYTITPSAAVGTGLSNYNITYNNGSLTVNKIAASVTATNQSKNYGVAVTPAGTEFTSSGFINGDAVTSVTLTSAGYAATATVVGGPYTITPSAAVGSGLGNYNITYNNGSLTVNKIAASVTATNQSKNYGVLVTPAGTEFTKSGFINGDNVTSVTLTSAGYAATATVAGSTYAITPSAAVGTGLGNYNITYNNGALTVNKISASVTATNQSKNYGVLVTPAGTEFTTSGFINGDAVATVTLTSAGYAATATVAGSTYAITPSAAVGTGLGNYNITYNNGALTVNKITASVTATNQSKNYGVLVTPAGTEFTSSGFINGDAVATVTLTSAGYAVTATVAGSPYTITPSAAVGTGLGNYNITYNNGSLTVNKISASVTATNQSKNYGVLVTPAGTEFTKSGFINGDTVTSVTLTSAGYVATATVAGSPYTITPSAAVGTGLGNYNITYNNGALTVNKIAASVTATNQSKNYGVLVTPAGTEFTSSGFINGDAVATVSLASAGYAATATVAGSPYTITPSAAVGTGLGNYNITYNNGALTVNKIAASVTATNQSKNYGVLVTPAGTEFTSSGFINGDAVATVSLASAGYAATATVAGSPYTITPSAAVGTGLGNYNITYNNGALTVNKIAASVTATNQSKNYGVAVTPVGTEFTTSGFVNTDGVTSVTLTSAGYAATATVAGSPYTITPSAAVGSGLANYNITYNNGALTVNKIAATVTASSGTKVHGTVSTGFGFTTSGLLNGDTITSVTLTSAGFPAAAAVPGPYSIVPSAAVGTGLGNYNISYTNGSITITKGAAAGTLHGITNTGTDVGVDSSGNTASLTSVAGQAVTLRADVTGTGATPAGGASAVTFWQFSTQASFDAYKAALLANNQALAASIKQANATNLNTALGFTPTYSSSGFTGSWTTPALNYPTLNAGAHLLAFDYAGDTNYFGFDPDMNWGVQQIPTTLTVTASASPTFGQPITFTALVTSTLPAYGHFGPLASDAATHSFVEGNVVFKDNGTAFATIPIGGQASGIGKAVSTSIVLPPGTGHTITAEYSDLGVQYAYGPSSNTVTPNVALAPTKVIITIDPTFTADCNPHGASAATVVADPALADNLGHTLPSSLVVYYAGTVSGGAVYPTGGGTTTVKPTLPGSYTAYASYPGDGFYLPSSLTVPFTITGTAGPATTGGLLYTGSLFFWTTGPSTSTASLALSCTVKALGQCPGNITGATVTFWASNDGGTSFQKIASAVDQPVGLVVPTDTTVGTASAIAQWNMKANNTVESFLLKITIGGLYRVGKDSGGNDLTYIYTVTVAKPLQTQATVTSLVGGGSVSNVGTAVYPASSGFIGNAPSTDTNDRTTFSADVSYNKSGTNVQGKATVTIRTLNKADGSVDDHAHTYVATSNSISELTLQATSPKYPVVSFSGKVNLKEVLADGSTVALDSGTMMNISVVDGNPDLVAIQIQKNQNKGGGLWYSSSWGPASPGALPSTLLKPMVVGTGDVQIK